MKIKPTPKRGRPKKQPQPKIQDWQSDLLPDFSKIKKTAKVWPEKTL